jgi:hypothetical protein
MNIIGGYSTECQSLQEGTIPRMPGTLLVHTWLIPNQARIRIDPSSASIPARANKAEFEAIGIADAAMVLIVEVEELLAGFGSICVAVTVAVLDTVPGVDGVVSTRLIVALPPLANAPAAHVTVVATLQDPCDGVAETSVVPAGRTSDTTTLLAAPGPLLTTLSA